MRYDSTTDLWVVTEPKEIRRIFLDSKTFGPENALDAITPLSRSALRELARSGFRLPPTLANNATDSHAALRKIAFDYVGPKQAVEAEPLIHKLAKEQLAEVSKQLETHGECDLVATIARGLPCEVIFNLLEVDNSRLADFHRWSTASLDLFWGFPDADEQMRLVAEVSEFHGWLRKHIESTVPEGIFATINQRDDLSINEKIAFCYFMLIAGQETTAQLISIALYRALSGETGSLDDVLTEDPPINSWRRVVKESTNVAGVELSAGTQLLLEFSAEACAHAKQQLTFGLGAHRCPGAELSKLEANIALHAVADRFPTLELVDPNPPMRRNLVSFSAPAQLLVRLREVAG